MIRKDVFHRYCCGRTNVDVVATAVIGWFDWVLLLSTLVLFWMVEPRSRWLGWGGVWSGVAAVVVLVASKIKRLHILRIE